MAQPAGHYGHRLDHRTRPLTGAGADIPVGENLYLNLDVKKACIRTDVARLGANLGPFKIDPVLFGIGLGWRF